MKRIVFALSPIFFFFSLSHGAVGFDFLNLPTSAREAGGMISLIGETNTSLSLRSNPAMLAGINRRAVSVDFNQILTDINAGSISGAIPLRNGSILSPAIRFMNTAKLENPVDENGDPINAYIAPFSFKIGGAWANNFWDRLNFGARLNFIHEQISQASAYWDAYFSGGFAADVGIFAKHNFFRYSAGFRNIGFAWDNYEYIDVKMPASAFAAIGFIIENQATLAWYLEYEAFFNDGQMFFRTGFEVPVHRDVIILRTGTIFTADDLRFVFNNVRGQTYRPGEHTSQTWLIAAVGATINARVASNILSLDIACQFRRGGIRPSFLFSGSLYF